MAIIILRVVPTLEPFNNQTVDELSQTLPSFDPTCYSEDGNSFTYDSTSNLVHDSPNDFSPPLQPPIYSYEFCGNNAYYGHDSTPSLSTDELDNSLSMRDEHLDTIPATKSDEFIKSSVESLVPIPSEFEGIPDNRCNVPFHDNSLPLDVSKDQFEDFSDSNDESTSTDDDSFSIDNIEYVEASPPDSEPISSKSSSTSLNSLLEETSTFDNSLPKLETFYFDLEEISSGSTTTHSDSSLYDSFIFDLFINPFPPVDRSDFYEFADELTPPEYDYFCFKNEPNSRDFTMDVVKDIFPTREPRVHNVLPTHPTL
nr:hypothetical protein [Tanacetum cinerariifolium]GEY90903.1 hypothetical protein [Tanacetum cinerariifolium]